MKVFKNNASLPKYLKEHSRLMELVLIAFWCVVFPVISAFCCTLGEQRPIYKSLSFIAYREDNMPAILFTAFCSSQGLFSQ